MLIHFFRISIFLGENSFFDVTCTPVYPFVSKKLQKRQRRSSHFFCGHPENYFELLFNVICRVQWKMGTWNWKAIVKYLIINRTGVRSTLNAYLMKVLLDMDRSLMQVFDPLDILFYKNLTLSRFFNRFFNE